MYKHYFQLQEAPFSIAPNPRFLYMSARHQEALAHLLYGIDNGGGFVVLTGDIGTGKTTLCRSLLDSLPENVDIALILNPKLNSLELLASICDELGITYPANETSLKVLIDQLNKYLLDSHGQGQRTVLIIDEAQNLSLEVLEQIRLLTNLETSEIKLLQIILVGQPELQQLLNDKKLRQLNQRISARYHLQTLTLSETQKYISHRLLVSKGNPKLFTNSAISKVFRYSQGIPRLINIICDRSLLGAYASHQKTISPSIVSQAAREVLWTETKSTKIKRYSLLAILFIALVVAGLLYYLGKITEDSQAPAVQTKPKVIKKLPASKPPVLESSSSVKSQATPTSVQQKTIVQPPKPIAETKPTNLPGLSHIINNQQLTLNSALSQLLSLWNKPAANDTQINCPYLQTQSLRCLSGTSTWAKISAFNRPVILELLLISGEIRHVLVTSDLEAQLQLSIAGKTMNFDRNEILSLWQGDYLLAWQTPLADTEYLYPYTQSEHILWLRNKLTEVDGINSGSSQLNYFDETIENRVRAFQKANGLIADGVIGPNTIIHLQNASSTSSFPTLN